MCILIIFPFEEMSGILKVIGAEVPDKISSDLDLTQKFDIRKLRKIKCYRGMRHSRGDRKLKVRVRGQRTRSTARRGKTGGVVRKRK